VRDVPAENDGRKARARVEVAGVEPGSPAASAGFRRGDRIEAVEGQAVESVEEYRFRIRDLPIGGTARIELVRGEQRLGLPLRAVQLAAEKLDALVTRRTGIELAEARGDGARYLVARTIRRDSPAARVGLVAGDVIREVNSREVTTLAEFRKQAGRARRSGQLVLLVQRGYAAERIAFDFD
jgi:S1-C subfamily serine protease